MCGRKAQLRVSRTPSEDSGENPELGTEWGPIGALFNIIILTATPLLPHLSFPVCAQIRHLHGSVSEQHAGLSCYLSHACGPWVILEGWDPGR